MPPIKFELPTGLHNQRVEQNCFLPSPEVLTLAFISLRLPLPYIEHNPRPASIQVLPMGIQIQVAWYWLPTMLLPRFEYSDEPDSGILFAACTAVFSNLFHATELCEQ